MDQEPIPKRNAPLSIDLHTHLRGTITPKLARHFAREHRHYLSDSLFDGQGGYRFETFDEFLRLYDQVGAVVGTARDLERLAKDYLMRSALGGTRYVEFMLSPDHSADNGIEIADQLDAVGRGIEAASVSEIRANVIVTAVRHRGPDAARDLAEKIADIRHPVVTGFGLTGNERKFDIAEFAGAFYVAGEIGLGLTAHAGEWLDAKSVLRAVKELRLNRVGHGYSIAGDAAVLEEIAERRIGLEVCLSSNLLLGRASELSSHPIRKMMDAGCVVTLATDDPGYFHTSPAREYCLARSAVGLGDNEIDQINRNAAFAAFCSSEIRQKLYAHVSLTD